jgi:hypothetical protein
MEKIMGLEWSVKDGEIEMDREDGAAMGVLER